MAIWTAIPLLAWLLIVASLSLLRPLPPARVARRIDAELALKERLATAWMLGAKSGDTGHRSPITEPLIALQQQDALAAAQAIEPRQALPLRWLHRPLLWAATLAALAIVSTALPNRMDARLAERAAIAEEAQAQAQRIEELAQQLETDELSPEEREELLRQLEALAKQLRDNRGDREEALANLSEIEERLKQKRDPNADARQATLDALAAELQALARGENAQGENGQEKADPAEMEEVLQELAQKLSQMSQAERKAAEQALAQMAARAAQAGDVDVAQALAALARAAQSSDGESAPSASDAAQAAAMAMAQARADLDAQVALQRALDQLQSSRQMIAQAGQGQSQSPNPGQGQQGQGQGGQGTKARQLPPGTGTGQADQPKGDAPSTGTDDQGQALYVPWERRQSQGDELFIPGQDSGQGETQTRERKDPLPGTTGEALVPYHEVYYQYLDAANQTIEHSPIPSGLKDYVRDYFSNLEP
jgi:hypothetical protein